MKGIELTLTPNKREVIIKIEPLLIDGIVEAKALFQIYNHSEFSGYYIDEGAFFTVAEALKDAVEVNEMSSIKQTVAHAKDAEIEVTIAGDKMSAELTLIAAYMGKLASLDDIFWVLKQHDVSKGISKKRIRKLIQSVSGQQGGRTFTDLVAKGLPPRGGNNSFIKSLVPCALERVLTPKYIVDKKIDMRDFGDILCVKKNEAIARRISPTDGRSGFTVTGEQLLSENGKWQEIKLGKHTCIDNADENLILATIAGLPKVTDLNIEVDNVYIVNGVNVSTGNVNFDGSIIVNGDITEKMQVVASGDITVNGFVESAHIKAGGDIIVVQGASGKLQNLDCEFIARGSIYIGHAQGVKINSHKDLIVDIQLAYSHIQCGGHITIGKIDNPIGKLFASTVMCAKTVRAGHLGAVSGSKLIIDYTQSHSNALKTHERLNAEFVKLTSKNAQHEIMIATINNRKSSKALKEKVALMNEELNLERVFVNWLRINVEESKEKLDSFDHSVRVIATHVMHCGVSVKLHRKQWHAKREYAKCRIILDNKNWIYMPLV
jgi:uncharacterized protein (DUF342 family)